MASGTFGDDLSEKHRWGMGNKVYSRKVSDKSIKRKKGSNYSIVPQESSQTLETGDANLYQQHRPVSRLDDMSDSDDSSRHNLMARVATGQLANGNGGIKPIITRVDDRVRIHLRAARSKNEFGELKRLLESELDQVRRLMKQLEAERVHFDGYSTGGVGNGYGYSQHSGNDMIKRGRLERVNSEVASVGDHDSRTFEQLSASVVENNHGVGEFSEKEKRTPKTNQHYRNSEFLLGKERFPPTMNNKKLKSSGGKKHTGDTGHRVAKDWTLAFKSCSNLLARLMKHKHAWVFNKPVDVKALELHDYYDIIKQPMDLGTVKGRLAKNSYKSPKEFAEAVRLTFQNAMTYNPKGQDVYLMAEELSQIFEENWAAIEAQCNPYRGNEMVNNGVLSNPTLRGNEMVNDGIVSNPTSSKAPPSLKRPPKTLNRSESRTEMTLHVDPEQKALNSGSAGRTPVPKKPKANDANKRDMTYEEKQRLSTNLQSLPSEKLENIVDIIKKRNPALCQQDEEIEVDIDSIDSETLWELDRLVTNYKKSLSKNKMKAERALQARVETNHPATMNQATVEPAKESTADEDQIGALSHVQREKPGDNGSRSSSSSSSSDSGSSSSGNSPRS